jgi:hypothetical protein
MSRTLLPPIIKDGEFSALICLRENFAQLDEV